MTVTVPTSYETPLRFSGAGFCSAGHCPGMSISYDKHKSQVEASRKSNGEFGSYEAAESATTLALTNDHQDDNAAQRVSDHLAVQDAITQMRTAGIGEINLAPTNSGLGDYYVDSVTDSSGRSLPANDMTYMRGEEIAGEADGHVIMANRLESLGWEKEIDGGFTINVNDEVGDGGSREAVAAERDRILEESKPKGPREALAEAMGLRGPNDRDGNPAYVAAVEGLDHADGLDRSPNEHVEDIDRQFPDDINKRKLARSVSDRMNHVDIDPFRQAATGSAHKYAMEQVAEGRSDETGIADEALKVYHLHVGIEDEYSEDHLAWVKAIEHAETRIAAGEDADQAYWNTVDHIDDLRADGKLDPHKAGN